MSKESKEAYIKDLKDVPDDTKEILNKVTQEVDGITPETILRWRVMSEEDAEAYNEEIKDLPDDTKKTVEEAIKAIKDQEGEAQKASEKIADKIEQPVEDMDLATPVEQEVNTGIIGKIRGKLGSIFNSGKSISDQEAAGIRAGSGNVWNAANQVGNDTAQVNKNSDNMWSWGYDMISKLAQGISDTSYKIRNKVQSIASTIWSNLHFSKPEEGVLRDYETWMPDFVTGLAETMGKSSPILENAASDLAGKVKEGFTINAADYNLDSEQFINYSKVRGNIDTTISSDIPNLIYDAIMEAMNNSNVNVQIEAKTEEGVILNKVSNGINQYVEQTGNLPFAIPI